MKRIKQPGPGVVDRYLGMIIGHEIHKTMAEEIVARRLVNWWGINGPPENTASRKHWNKYVTPKHIDDFIKEQAERDRLWEKAYDFSKLEIGTVTQSEWDELIRKTTGQCLPSAS